MDEDAGVRAPVTRLRRRLSVEQTEESKSPAVGTPTKKRGGRKAAKPDLELIDENTPDNTTTKRITKKTAIKDVTAPEEKPVTPARRSTRVKSNTSIISEAAAVIDSPRAKRATRRASLAGSDTEAPLTPIRQTRRTRKDSASSVENDPQPPPKQGIQITEVIIEEPEANSINSTPHAEIATEQSSPNSTRKSPRLLEKKKTSPAKITVEESRNIPLSETTAILAQNSSVIQDSISLSSEDTSDEPKNKTVEHAGETSPIKVNTFTPIIDKKDTPNTQSSDTNTLHKNSKNRLSIDSAKLIKELNTDVKSKSNFNKSWSDADSKESTTKRKRTKSWTTLSASNENQFYSDNESTKHQIKNSITSPSMFLNKSGSGDGALNTSLNHSISNKSASKRKKKDSMNFVVENINKPLDEINTIDNNIETKNETLSISQNRTKNHDSITSKLLEREPSGDIKTMIYIEDSDSNSEKINIKPHENEDQCVPVVEHAGETSPIKVNTFTSILDKNEQNMLNDSKELPQRKDSEQMDYEPMDIDETIPDNTIINEVESTDLDKSGSKSHICNLSGEEIVNKSGIKSSIPQSFDKSETETKSTFKLSQIKDTSTRDISNAANLPQVISNKLLSTVDDLNITQENDMQKNLSRHYSTSTPIQDKNIKNYKATQVNTSIPAIQINESINMIKEVPNTSKDQHKNISKTEHNESAEDIKSKEPIYTGNVKNKDRVKKTSNKKETSLNQSKIEVNESKGKAETDEDVFNENRSNVNDEDVVTHKHKSKVEYVSLNKKSNKPLTKTNVSQKNKSSSEESEEEIESDDDAAENSLFIDEEAVDAGDDYESGDSQNESERRYAKENEVLDKGETLTTDDEFSDESDYEKDSFIVSSNEEDDELLDGTDDDLSMSDKELKITVKSKKKYNDRKVKEQKEASREMFDSRHKLNSSNKSTNSEISKTKKIKRHQISSSESEEDIKPRKSNRLRLDSTKEDSLLADKSEHKISIKKNKQQQQNKKEITTCNESMKRMDSTIEASLLADKSEHKIADSDSSNDDSVPNEKEMTISNDTIKESDPLSAQIKTEPKTPKKCANSTIAFIDSEEVDNDQIDKNESTKTQSEFLDPLQATMLADEDDDSLSSDTDIMQNYDSVLKDLHKSCKLKPKVCDISLNLDNRSKMKQKTAIVDELNLTQVKSDKKPKNKQKREPSTSVNEKVSKRDDDGASSDSIDLHLLFSEDSNNSDTSSLQNKMKAANTNPEQIIPLKRTEAKTDIREKKGDEEQTASFFIDTVGSHAQDDKNQFTENFDFIKDNSVNKSVSNTPAKGSCEDDAPLEISYQKEESAKRKSKTQDKVDIVIDQTGYEPNKSLNKPIAKTPSSEKKNKKKTMEEEISEHGDYEPDQSINKSIAKTSGSENKNKNKAMDEEISEHADLMSDPTSNKSLLKTPNSGKKKKRQTESHSEEQNANQAVPLESKTSSKKKSKKTGSNLLDKIPVIPDNQDLPNDSETSEKKKHKHNASSSIAADENIPVEITQNIETSLKKRKRKSSPNTTKEEILPADVDTAKPLYESIFTSKKKKRKIVTQDEIVSETVPIAEKHDESRNKRQDKKSPSNVLNSSSNIGDMNKKRNKKRKERDDDDTSSSKIPKVNIFDRVPRLPPNLLEKLDDVPHIEVASKKPKLISTTQFLVEETMKRKNKPSDYLEESVYLNESTEKKGYKKKHLEKPKVLPFVPTASTSNSGFTTNFKINVLPRDITFVAQSNTIDNFKDNYMFGKKIKRLGTFDLYKRQRNIKLSKF